MTSFTDDEIRQIYTFLPLDDGPYISNIDHYLFNLCRNNIALWHKILNDRENWEQEVNYNQFNQQYNQLIDQLGNIIEDWRYKRAEMISLNWQNQNIPTNYEEIEEKVLGPYSFYNAKRYV